MKIIAVVLGVLMALIVTTAGLKNAICGLKHSFDGDGQVACQAYMPSWSYNADAKECVSFVFGGCGGNQNRFLSRDDCDAKCKE